MLLLRQLCASAATAVASCGGGVSWRAAAAAAAAAAQTLAAAAAASPAPASPPATQRRALHLAPPFLVEDYVPVSVMTHRLGRARQKAARALEQLKACRACPRDCGVDRAAGAVGVCGVGRHAVVATVAPHYGEEACLQGWRGSGTIFFSGCSMRCVFCQNWDISWPRGGGGGGGDKSNGSSSGGGSSSSGGSSSGSTPAVKGFELTADALAGWMLKLQDEGRVHNINLVTPEHVVPQVVEALALALDKGLSLPIVYNTRCGEWGGCWMCVFACVEVWGGVCLFAPHSLCFIRFLLFPTSSPPAATTTLLSKSGYDSLESLRLLEGLVDIYMPDFKFWTAGSGERYARCRDYPDAARAAIKEMHRQVIMMMMMPAGRRRGGGDRECVQTPDLSACPAAFLCTLCTSSTTQALPFLPKPLLTARHHRSATSSSRPTASPSAACCCATS